MVTPEAVTASLGGILLSASAAEERRQSLGFAAKSHAVEPGLRRASERTRPLEHAEVLVLQEAMREVRWAAVSARMVLGQLWPAVLEELAPTSFKVARTAGQQFCSHPGHHVIGDPLILHGDREWLLAHMVMAVHVEACARMVRTSFGLSPDEADYVTHNLADLAEVYERIVNAVAIYNTLTWVFGRAQTAAHEEADDRHTKLAFAATAQKWVSPCLVPASLRHTDTVIIPGGPHAGEVLTADLLRVTLVGERFASHFQC